MNAHERLRAARLGALNGQYAEALAEYVWFHHNALAEQPSLYGVRLSFALAYWKELAEIYPPAMMALHQTRAEKLQRLRAGELDRELLHDVEAINSHLDADSETAELFEALDRDHPEFAQTCSHLVLEALAKAGRFHLAAKYIPDPIARIVTLAERLNDDIAHIPERPRSKSPRYMAYSWCFALELHTIRSVLAGANRSADADDCNAKAFSTLKPWYVRKAVERALMSHAQASPNEQVT
ncbi:MAG: hypothetical protein QM776_10775 [Rhodocyclaceae bacterium]